MPKLHEILIEGKQLSAQDIKDIKGEVNAIRDKAVKKAQEATALNDKDQAELKEFRANAKKAQAEQFDKDLKENFIKAGGNEAKFEHFKKIAGKVEDVTKYDYKKTMQDFPDFKSKVIPKPNGALSGIVHVVGGEAKPNGTEVKVY